MHARDGNSHLPRRERDVEPIVDEKRHACCRAGRLDRPRRLDKQRDLLACALLLRAKLHRREARAYRSLDDLADAPPFRITRPDDEIRCDRKTCPQSLVAHGKAHKAVSHLLI